MPYISTLEAEDLGPCPCVAGAAGPRGSPARQEPVISRRAREPRSGGRPARRMAAEPGEGRPTKFQYRMPENP